MPTRNGRITPHFRLFMKPASMFSPHPVNHSHYFRRTYTYIILETSVQASQLIPMAISLGFGIVFAAAIILVIVPYLYMILEYIMRFTKKDLASIMSEENIVQQKTGSYHQVRTFLILKIKNL